MISAPAALLLAALAPGPVCGADGELAQRVLLAELNAARLGAGSAPVAAHPALCETARRRAGDVAASGSTDPDLAVLQESSRRLRRAGYSAHRWIGSTLLGSRDAGLLGQWREARPQWHAQAVRGDFEDIGIGLARHEDRPVVTLLLALRTLTADLRQAAPLADLKRVRRAALAAVNAARRERNRAPVEPDPRLDSAAQRHAEDMLRRAYYSHRSPEGATPAERARAAGHRGARTLSENIAKGLFTPDEVVRRWLTSSGHRRNILRRGARRVGLGVAFGENRNGFEVVWVQLFAG